LATFTTWDALITAIKDAIATHVATGDFRLRSITIGAGAAAHTRQVATFDDLKGALEWAKAMKEIEATEATSRVSFGRFRKDYR
jgi:hypothetical protein